MRGSLRISERQEVVGEAYEYWTKMEGGRKGSQIETGMHGGDGGYDYESESVLLLDKYLYTLAFLYH